ncbi:hypothetical protein [Sphingomonas sp. LHG3406-1]|uniref:hypothetical protein n=1 Tax=Sphingomonas sp. LHG3406-1 TaxID=2804617 RepID=UPI00261ACA5F|nr:hypothetical protein [Sphingomonas sp. LHG3406-1]
MIIRCSIALALAAATSMTAVAQTPASISPGLQVVDPAGNPVGTVASVNGDQLIVRTDKHEVLLPASSFTPNQGRLIFALTRDQLNAQTDQAKAEANAKLVAGVSVYGASGTLAGTIDAIDDQSVTLKLTTGKLVRLPRAGIAPSDKGATLGISAAELQRLAEQSN